MAFLKLKRQNQLSLLSLLFTTSLIAGVSGCHHDPPCDDMGPADLAVPADMTVTPPDLSPCNPADPNCPQPDMAKPPADMTVPPADMTMPPPVDMSMPPADMTMNPLDMTSTSDMSMPPTDMTMPPADMSKPTDMTMPPADMSKPGDMSTRTDMAMSGDMSTRDGGSGMAGIGDPCTGDSDCKIGPTPSCWKANILNNPANPATPSGYCSSKCTADTDCGSGASCVNLGAGKFCLKSCADATTCRHPGYACAYYGASGICYPDTIFDCDTSTATCTEAGTMKTGGCLRGAYENKGTCSATCTVGAGNCPDSGTTKRECIYLDTTRSGDAYKGLICVNQLASPKSTGTACMYLNDCVDGDECSPADGTCHAMCTKGGMPACAMGTTCTDDFMTPATGPGLCD